MLFQLEREVRGQMRQSELLRIVDEMRKTERRSQSFIDSAKRELAKACASLLQHL